MVPSAQRVGDVPKEGVDTYGTRPVEVFTWGSQRLTGAHMGGGSHMAHMGLAGEHMGSHGSHGDLSPFPLKGMAEPPATGPPVGCMTRLSGGW